MEAAIHSLLEPLHFLMLCGILGIFLMVLGKGADILVDEAVALSLKLNIPRVLIGATIVSLGTTAPETAVSVTAALQGNPGLALGNAVGSIICDTGLILGIGALIRPLPLDRKVVNRQGWVQFGSGVLLVILCLPFANLPSIFTDGGNLPQAGGFLLVGLLFVYFYWSYRQARHATADPLPEGGLEASNKPTWQALLKLVFGLLLVIGSSKVIIPTAEIMAYRLEVPEAIVAALLIAFGTSLPELVTVVTAVLKGQGSLAVGNVIGADILNVLFVAGLSAAVTSGGLQAPAEFFTLLFPAMLFILAVFRIGIFLSPTHLSRTFGALLLGLYGVFLGLNIYLN
jgi:cation:H+ antiporter